MFSTYLISFSNSLRLSGVGLGAQLGPKALCDQAPVPLSRLLFLFFQLCHILAITRTSLILSDPLYLVRHLHGRECPLLFLPVQLLLVSQSSGQASLPVSSGSETPQPLPLPEQAGWVSLSVPLSAYFYSSPCRAPQQLAPSEWLVN